MKNPEVFIVKLREVNKERRVVDWKIRLFITRYLSVTGNIVRKMKRWFLHLDNSNRNENSCGNWHRYTKCLFSFYNIRRSYLVSLIESFPIGKNVFFESMRIWPMDDAMRGSLPDGEWVCLHDEAQKRRRGKWEGGGKGRRDGKGKEKHGTDTPFWPPIISYASTIKRGNP